MNEQKYPQIITKYAPYLFVPLNQVIYHRLDYRKYIWSTQVDLHTTVKPGQNTNIAMYQQANRYLKAIAAILAFKFQ